MRTIEGQWVGGVSGPQLGQETRLSPLPAEEADTFSKVLEGAVASANSRALSAQAAAQAFAAGARDDIHGTMLALSKADIELRLVGSIRNKVIDAFHEIWRMQL